MQIESLAGNKLYNFLYVELSTPLNEKMMMAHRQRRLAAYKSNNTIAQGTSALAPKHEKKVLLESLTEPPWLLSLRATYRKLHQHLSRPAYRAGRLQSLFLQSASHVLA